MAFLRVQDAGGLKKSGVGIRTAIGKQTLRYRSRFYRLYQSGLSSRLYNLGYIKFL